MSVERPEWLKKVKILADECDKLLKLLANDVELKMPETLFALREYKANCESILDYLKVRKE